MSRFLTALLLFGLLLPSARASDLEKEKRWADQIVDALIDGEAELLKAGDTEFLAIFTEAEDPGSNAALVLHGMGAHPDWPQVVYPLRTGLPANGWSTLSLQMPVLPNEAQHNEYAPLFEEVAPRIEAGIAYLEEKGADRIVIVAHSLGTAMASYYLSGDPEGVAGLVGIGMPGGAEDPRMDNLASLPKVRVPVLDVYGQNDSDGVFRTSAARMEAASGNPDYSQVQVPNADHFFDGQDEVLLGIVVDWLGRIRPPAPD